MLRRPSLLYFFDVDHRRRPYSAWKEEVEPMLEFITTLMDVTVDVPEGQVH
jgi:hypothetical protein